MIDAEKLFDNIFESTDITNQRLGNFGASTLRRLTSANTGGAYTALIALLTGPVENMNNSLNGVDTSLNIQKAKTTLLDFMIKDFKHTMSTQEGVIANAVGGFGSEGYVQFYPKGLSEYGKANKTTMLTLVDRVYTVAGTYSLQLGKPLTDTLQGFKVSWTESRGAQESEKSTVGNNRSARGTVRTELTEVLTTVVRTISGMYPNDVAQCMQFFNFSLLKRSAQKGLKEKLSGEVLSGKVNTAINKAFTGETTARITNTSDNASLFLYLAANADAHKNGKGVEVKAGRSRNFTMEQLGDVNNTFLLVQNLSDVNNAGYELVIDN